MEDIAVKFLALDCCDYNAFVYNWKCNYTDFGNSDVYTFSENIRSH